MTVPRYIVIDTETTGLSFATCGPIEVAAALLDDDLLEIDRYHSLINPHGLVWEEYPFRNNAAWCDWGAPDIHDARIDFLAWARGLGILSTLHPVGSNVEFDVRMMRLEGVFSHRVINTTGLIAPYYLTGEIDGLGLKHARKLVGLEGEQAHRAEQDVDDTIAVLRWARDQRRTQR